MILVYDSYLIALIQCQGALWGLAGYENGFTEGMEHMSHDDVFSNCEGLCGTLKCHELNPQDFENHQNCYRSGFHSSPTVKLDGQVEADLENNL